MIYTEVETWNASPYERWQVLCLLWRATRGLPLRPRISLRRMAFRTYVLSRHAKVSQYIVNHHA